MKVVFGVVLVSMFATIVFAQMSIERLKSTYFYRELAFVCKKCSYLSSDLWADAKKTKKKSRKRKAPLTVSGAISKYGTKARKKLKKKFEKSGVSYPPSEIVLIGLKQEEELFVYAKDSKSKSFKRVLDYPILGTSGVAGPKLKQGDYQMPEGFYRISAFNPNSRFHLSLRVNYPNSEDKRNGKNDKRSDLGGDIMIHGSDCSIGCLAMGDDVIEQLFTLVHDTGRSSTKVILAPCDLTSKKPIIDMKKQPKWLPDLYLRLKQALSQYLG